MATALLAVAPTPAVAAGPASVSVAECRGTEGGGAAGFRGSMRALPGTRRMAMRFVLLERLGRRPFVALQAPGLGRWQTSRSGAGRFRVTQPVQGLLPGGHYRAQVSFRWLGADGRVLSRTQRRSSVCALPGTPPNLTIAGFIERPGPVDGTSIFSIEVVNESDIAYDGLELSLRVDGSELDRVEVNALLPRERRTVQITGPPCRRRFRVELAVGQVREADLTDNGRGGRCPAMAARR